MAGFVSFVAILVLLPASGMNVPVNESIFAALGVSFMVIGNYLGKTRKNFFSGDSYTVGACE
jgi:hypothetical protein